MLARPSKSHPDGEGGFTLIELLVVMIVIGVLAAVAIPTFLSQRVKAAETAAKSDATFISKEIAAALVDGQLTGATPVSLALAAGVHTLSVTTTDAMTAKTSVVKVTAGNSAAVTATAPGTYCVTVTPTGGGAAWSAGNNGLIKGGSC